MEAILTDPAGMKTGALESAAFKVVMLYEDFATGQRAMQTCQHLIRRFGQDFQFKMSLWKLEVLQAPRIEEVAALDAMEADMIIVSTRGSGATPVEIKTWFDRWLRSRAEGPGALVELHERTGDVRDSVSSSHLYLQEVAAKAKMEFFSAEFKASDGDSGFSTEEIAERAEKISTVLEGILRVPRSIPRWGINE